MPLYIADYLADTTHLGALQSGAYLHLIMHYWQHKKLPIDDASLGRIARLTPAEWKRERATLAAFFTDGWRHKRIDGELAHADAKIGAKSDAGKAGAAKRWGGHSKDDGKGMADAGGSQWQTDAPSQSQPETEKNRDEAPSQASGAAIENLVLQSEESARPERQRYSDDFEAVWAEYRPIASPNATKADAMRAFARLSKPDREACWAGVVRYVQWLLEQRRKRGDFPAKHLATFINRRGWETFMDEAMA
jgi:uncharacterized protein YdaU (DUF1376 family)